MMGGVNVYAHVGNSPLGNADATGLAAAPSPPRVGNPWVNCGVSAAYSAITYITGGRCRSFPGAICRAALACAAAAAATFIVLGLALIPLLAGVMAVIGPCLAGLLTSLLNNMFQPFCDPLDCPQAPDPSDQQCKLASG